MKGWKYVGKAHVLILARKDDYAKVPQALVTEMQGVVPVPWGSRAGNPLPDHLVGADRQAIETALTTHGWFSS